LSRNPTAEQKLRFKRFCEALVNDIQANAYRAAITAGYSLRMAKSKSYLLARRAWPTVRHAWNRKHFSPEIMAEKRRRYYEERTARRLARQRVASQ
jgi:phage terminase small subunit